MVWQLPECNDAVAGRLQAALGLPPVLARLLAARGWQDEEAVAQFLSPRLDQMHSPWRMRGMETAVGRILNAITAGEPILIYGDYDVDGATSVVILRKALQMLGGSPDWFIPQRLVEGYGVHLDAIEQAARDGVSLMITVDTGIRAGQALQRAQELGIDVIVTDHHLPEESLPPAFAILNPHQPGCAYPERNLAGVGVTFKLIQALFERQGRSAAGEWPARLTAFLKLAAIGTIADSVPLLGENRVIARYGLEGLDRPLNPGLQALLQRALPGKNRVTADDIAYRVAPRLNAAGRMGGAGHVVELFSATAADAAQMAERLEALNLARREAVEAILREIDARLARDPNLGDAPVLVMDGEGWHRGVLGIVASRILDRHGKPALVISRENGMGHGSGRSRDGMHLLQLVEHCPELFERYGGHAQAIGFSLPADRIEQLRQRLIQIAVSLPPAASPQPCADLEIRLGEVGPQFLDAVSRLEPCGQANPAPYFLARGVTTVGPPRILKEKHLKLRLEQDGHCLEALAWNVCGDAAAPGRPGPDQIPAGTLLDVVFRAELNQHPQFGDRIQLILADYRIARGLPAVP